MSDVCVCTFLQRQVLFDQVAFVAGVVLPTPYWAKIRRPSLFWRATNQSPTTHAGKKGFVKGHAGAAELKAPGTKTRKRKCCVLFGRWNVKCVSALEKEMGEVRGNGG